MATEPYEAAYPVKFQSGGDTTKEAFGKHIQEIERIYGILNVLNSSKVSADEVTSKLQGHINNSNPHPNLYLTTLKGNLPVDRVDGNWPTSRISGNLDISRINGNLDTSRVTGLESYIKTISKKAIGDELNGSTYMTVGNILLQWGLYTLPEITQGAPVNVTVTLPKGYTIFNINHLDSDGSIKETTVHALYVVEAFVVANNYNGMKITLDLHEDYTVEQGKKGNSFVLTASLSGRSACRGYHFLWNAWGIGA